jgi:hypothetical protein
VNGALLFATYSNPMRVCDSADFDPSTDYMTRGATLTGASDSKTGIFSAWVRLDGNDVADRLLSNATTVAGFFERLIIGRGSDFRYSIRGKNSSDTTILSIDSSSTFTTSATWIHVLSSWDLATGSAHLYINGTSDVSGTPTTTNDTIDYTVADWSVAARPDSSSGLNGCIADLYFAPGQYLDFSLLYNRLKFRSASGKPVHLGSAGALPTGTAPLIYLHIDDAEAVANFATNRGTGGNFSITGSLATGSTSPSD